MLLVSTALKDARDWHRNEVLEIAENVPPDASDWAGEYVGAVLRLATPATHAHAANSAYQGEVGLLSRRLRIQGAAADS